MRPLFLCSLLGHYYITRRSNSIQHHHHYRHYAHLLLTESEGSSAGSENVHGMGHDSARAIQFVKWKFFSAIVIKFTNRFYTRREENEGWFAIYSGEGSFVPGDCQPSKWAMDWSQLEAQSGVVICQYRIVIVVMPLRPLFDISMVYYINIHTCRQWL